MSDNTIYLDEGQLPPTIIYVVWGDPENPFMTTYKPQMRQGRAVGVRDDGSTATVIPKPKPETYEMFTEAGATAVRNLIIEPAMQVMGGPDRHQVLSECSLILDRGIAEVAQAGHREVNDTAVREAIYGFIGQVLMDQGYTDSRYDWEV